jgi:hypothetical protein
MRSPALLLVVLAAWIGMPEARGQAPGSNQGQNQNQVQAQSSFRSAHGTADSHSGTGCFDHDRDVGAAKDREGAAGS